VEALQMSLGRAEQDSVCRFQVGISAKWVPSPRWASAGLEVSVYHMPQPRNLDADSKRVGVRHFFIRR
jgi:hypothetical protein